MAKQEPAHSVDQPKVKGGLRALGHEFLTRFNNNECATRAQALAFGGILSLVPLLLCALAILSFLIRAPQQAADYVQSIVKQMLPGKAAGLAADEFVRQTHIVETAQTLMQGRWWTVILGGGSLFWGTLSLVVSATTPMNAAWEVKETRSFIKLRLVCLGVLLVVALLFVLSLLPSFAPTFLRNLHIPGLNFPTPTPFWMETLLELVAWGINIGIFVLLYKFLPNAFVSWRAALFGGVITGFLWELFKKGFANYLSQFDNFNKVYGALGGIFLLITWIYYSCLILLVGAILCKMYYERREEGGVAKQESVPDVDTPV